MGIVDCHAGISRNAISAELEKLSQVCRNGMSEKLISDETAAHLIAYGLIKSKVETGELSPDCLDEYASSFNQGNK